MRISKLWTRLGIFTLLVCAAAMSLTVWGCASVFEDGKPGLGSEMRDAYKTSTSLFGYAWSPKLFSDPAYEQKILQLLDRLLADFHRVDRISPGAQVEPGFKIALETQQKLLSDIRQRFASGNKEYARWRLRGLTANCVTCHSRVQSPNDFIGGSVEPAENTFEARFAAAEYLVATRQFSEGEESLLALSKEVSQVPAGESYALKTLKLLLLIEIRVKQDFKSAYADLKSVVENGKFHEEERNLIQLWMKDLLELPQEPAKSPGDLYKQATQLLPKDDSNRSLVADEQGLVRTIHASGLLHTLLSQPLTDDLRRKASFELARSYAHMPISSFEVLTDLYLEQCIREFPGTSEAKRAFALYKENYEFLNTGSSGLHLEEEDNKKLKELEALSQKPA